MSKKKDRVVGIDLGTTNSLIAHIKDESPRIIPNDRGDRLTPSVVFFREDGETVVGEMAKNQAVLNAGRTITRVKLAMGTDKTFTIGKITYTPTIISGFILKHLKTYAEQFLGESFEKAVITVPAYFNDRQREDTLKAAQTAGLNVVKLLNEPTAAALAYGLGTKVGAHLLVLDLGGGTFDITLMEYEDNVFRVKGVGGSTSTGGSDFDDRITEHILKDFEQTYGIDLSGDKIAHQQLIIHAEKAKIDLSSSEETRIMIPYITATPKGPIHLNVSLPRQRFNKLIQPVLKRMEDRIRATFDQADLPPSWVETIILVGGSTRVPAVVDLIKRIVLPGVDGQHEKDKDKTARPAVTLKHNINPDEAVARGAGILAGILEGSMKGIRFHDITPHDLGVEDDKGAFVTVMPRGKAYPAEAFRLFTTTRDNQKKVLIHVLQQVGMTEKKRVSLGWFELGIKTPKPKGEVSIDVTFAIDKNGLLNVSAVDLDGGEHREISITHGHFADINKSEFPGENTPGKSAYKPKPQSGRISSDT